MSASKTVLGKLFGRLWRDYSGRVSYARCYRQLLRRHGGRFENDHVAFRTFACQSPPLGADTLARPFVALGYRAAGLYDFPDKKLRSVHYAPPAEGLPKLFVSELQLWELSPALRRAVLRTVGVGRPSLTDGALAELSRVTSLAPGRRARLLAVWLRLLSRSWPAPAREDVLAAEQESQFAAWTLLHGHSVNHFTAAVHAQGVAALPDIESTVAALKAEGVPMKAEIEGERGSRLRQSSTHSVELPTPMRERGRVKSFPWTYAYFELAERPLIEGRRFEGFLGPQASSLFEMTRRS